MDCAYAVNALRQWHLVCTMEPTFVVSDKMCVCVSHRCRAPNIRYAIENKILTNVSERACERRQHQFTQAYLINLSHGQSKYIYLYNETCSIHLTDTPSVLCVSV